MARRAVPGKTCPTPLSSFPGTASVVSLTPWRSVLPARKYLQGKPFQQLCSRARGSKLVRLSPWQGERFHLAVVFVAHACTTSEIYSSFIIIIDHKIIILLLSIFFIYLLLLLLQMYFFSIHSNTYRVGQQDRRGFCCCYR